MTNSFAYVAPGMKERPGFSRKIYCSYNPAPFIDKVCQFYNITGEEIRKRCRVRRFCLPRHVAMYVLRKETSMSLKEIGMALSPPGKRSYDHTTVIHSVDLITKLTSYDDDLRDAVRHLSVFIR